MEDEPTRLDGPDGSKFTHHMSFPPLPRFWISIFGIELGHLGHLSHLPLGFSFLATNCVFHCHASAGCLLGLLCLLITNCGISFLYRVFCHFFVLGCCVFRSPNWIDKNGSRKLAISASNFDSQCRLLRHPLCLISLPALSLFHMAFYHHLTLRGCDLNLAHLIAKNGSWNLPFSASNCDIRCYIWLYFCLASGESPSCAHMGFTNNFTT